MDFIHLHHANGSEHATHSGMGHDHGCFDIHPHHHGVPHHGDAHHLVTDTNIISIDLSHVHNVQGDGIHDPSNYVMTDHGMQPIGDGSHYPRDYVHTINNGDQPVGDGIHYPLGYSQVDGHAFYGGLLPMPHPIPHHHSTALVLGPNSVSTELVL